ncbi:L-type lectin-domain containing receptor kinase IX.1-like [Syzygium oleosum]|uniref:L-type lectin-domain containing receptor kinase IX.1-like n=1 Tax=Syzygium oleosum TaxID=219896 RepID=UPI0024BB005C|nr:L-type lectin-domain containing receptor kinase IX.1-like [Syzygium oleosum]
MPEGNNAPKTTKENKTKTERGGEEGGHCAKLIEEIEKLSGPKKFSYEESMIATDSFAHDRILGGGGFGDNVACVRLKVARPYRSNDMPEGKNAPKTTEENKTETKRGGEEGKLKDELDLTQKKYKEEEELTNLGVPKKYSYRELSGATNSFASGLKLGRGGFGIVYKGYIGEDCTPVAVKKIRYGSRQGREEYISKVKSLSQLGHIHLVKLKGYCHEANKFILVYKFMKQGSLADHLFEDKPLLTWERRYNIALGLAKALHYLHKQFRQCIIHKDIKSDNVMLDEKFEAKLGDFGLAKLVDHTRVPSTTQVKGTLGYLAPEYFRTGKASKESDIYSFGVVLLEILCGRKAPDLKLAEQGCLVLWVWKRSGCRSWWGRRFWNLHLPVDERLGKDFNKKQAEALMIVGLCCAHPFARSRPLIEEAMVVLNLTLEPRKLSSKMPSFDI